MPMTQLSDYNPVFKREELTTITGNYVDLGRPEALKSETLTLAMSFSLSSVNGYSALVSKDQDGNNAGDFTVWVKNGELILDLDTDSDSLWLRAPDVMLETDQTYHLAVSFGPMGASVWLNGSLVAAEPEFRQGLETNDNKLVLGATRAWRDQQSDLAHEAIQGEIADVAFFDEQLSSSDIAELAEISRAGDTIDPVTAHQISEVLEAFNQMHHASDTLKDLAEEYGISTHGQLMFPPEIEMGSNANETLMGSYLKDAQHGGKGDDVVAGKGGDDLIQGGYGNDRLFGGNGNDVIDGGHGEDRLVGNDGDDLLISRADGREPKITYVPGREEGDPRNELTNGKYYSDQPIPSDDILIGGNGADTFYFQTLINAKKYIIREHTRSDGTINWHGVAGENNNLHDHWVDTLGTDTILDFSKSEGDRIIIEGHTTEIDTITYGDINGDGVMDHSIINVYSDQGNGGAHHLDKLGTIIVYGDLVREADVIHSSKPAYGIVDKSDSMLEAGRPLAISKDIDFDDKPDQLAKSMATSLLSSKEAIFEVNAIAPLTGNRGDYFDVGHHQNLAAAAATFSLTFKAYNLDEQRAILSKDSSLEGQGGFTVWIDKNGHLIVTHQANNEEVWYKVNDIEIEAGDLHHLAVSFGSKGLLVWLDGELVGAKFSYKHGIEGNDFSLVVGGSRSHRDDQSDQAHSLFEGLVGEVSAYDSQLSSDDIAALAAASSAGSVSEKWVDYYNENLKFGGGGQDIFMGLKGVDTLFGGDNKDMLYGGKENDILFGGAGDDRLKGNLHDDHLYGDEGRDVLMGGGNNDVLEGGTGSDWLYGENGADHLIGGAGNDALIGGAGRDVFVFKDHGFGYDKIKDWEDGQDKIDLTDLNLASFENDIVANASQKGAGVKINLGDGDNIFIEGMLLGDLSTNDFIL